jgi:NTE family protein
MTRALVLGGGGVVGIAWETGVLKGLRDGGVDPAAAELIVGTSAGSVVGTQVRGGRSLDELYAEQSAPSDGRLEQAAGPDLEKLMAIFARWSQAMEMTEQLCAEIGAQALQAKTVPESEWLAAIGARLPSASVWPEGNLVVTAVDAESGVFRTWDRACGVALTPAVASSCAVPGMFPPVTITGRRYIDGGVRSGTSADLARGHDTVVLVAPIGGSAAGIGAIARRQLDTEVETLRSAGSTVDVILPDAQAQEAFGPNLMDPSRRAAAAEAGLRQGTEAAARLASLWQATAGSTSS